jgi:serine/threonine protein kinase
MNNTTNTHNALPIAYRIKNYQILNILGNGGFGITYLAKDTKLKTLVAIKEYLPNELAVRDDKNYKVLPKSKKEAKNFAWGLDRFVKEAQILAQFKHPNIIRVLHFFYAHNTAYIVMEYEHGQNLAGFLKAEDTATEEELMRFLPAFLDGLETVHKAGYLHRDIKPANIYIRKQDYSPLLIDFGAARNDLSHRVGNITTLISPGYTPFEQYQSDADANLQGTWTDIYAAGAILYRLICTKIPPDATMRATAIKQNQADPLKPATQVAQGEYAQALLEAIDWALKVNPHDRAQNVKAWREKIFGKQLLEKEEIATTQPIVSSSTKQFTPPPALSRWLSPFAIGVSVVVLILIALFIVLGAGWLFSREHKAPIQAEAEAEAEAEEAAEKAHREPAVVVATSAPTDREPENAATKITPAPIELETANAITPREARLRSAAKERAAIAQAQLPSEPLRMITGAGVQLRIQPRLDATRGAVLQIGTIVSELENTKQGGKTWYRVKTSSDEDGWVHGKYTLFLAPDKRAQAYIGIAKRKLNSRSASFGDLVDLCNFLSSVSDEVELESAVELKLLYLLALQRSLDKIPQTKKNELRYAEWLSGHSAEIVHNVSRGTWVVKRTQFQQLHDKYSFLPIAERILH